jgi:NADH:ubiquinone oxidoreductase subunit 6 (subunit J)
LDVVLTIVFYGCAIVAVGGALAAALAPAPSGRLLGLLGVAVGAAGLLLSLEAGFAALLALVGLTAAAVLLGGGEARAERAAGPRAGLHRVALPPADLPAQLGAVGAALLLVALLVIAFGGSFVSGAAGGGTFAAAAVGRALFGRDALATEAVGVSLLVALAVGALAWSRRP